MILLSLMALTVRTTADSEHKTETMVPAGKEFREIRAAIQNKVLDEGVTSVVVAVARDGQIIWEEAFGDSKETT